MDWIRLKGRPIRPRPSSYLSMHASVCLSGILCSRRHHCHCHCPFPLPTSPPEKTRRPTVCTMYSSGHPRRPSIHPCNPFLKKTNVQQTNKETTNAYPFLSVSSCSWLLHPPIHYNMIQIHSLLTTQKREIKLINEKAEHEIK